MRDTTKAFKLASP